MGSSPSLPAAALLREVVRLYAQAQRSTVACCEGTSGTQCHILTAFDRAETLPLTRLGQQLGLEKSWTSRAVGRLADEGLLVKEEDPEDRRNLVIRPTEAGRRRIEALGRTLNAHAGQVMARIPEADRPGVLRSLELLKAALQKEAGTPEIRPARCTDRQAVEALLTQAGLPLAGAAGHLEQFLVAEDGDSLLAALGIEVYGTSGLLRSAVVAPGSRGQGWGTLLVRRLLDRSRDQGLKTVILLTETARDFFEGFGFRAVDRGQVPEELKASAEFQGACPVSATVMRLDLGAGAPGNRNPHRPVRSDAGALRPVAEIRFSR